MENRLESIIKEYNKRLRVRDNRTSEFLEVRREEDYNEDFDRKNYKVSVFCKGESLYSRNKVVIPEVDRELIYDELDNWILTDLTIFGLNSIKNYFRVTNGE